MGSETRKKIKIFIGPVEISGIYTSLAYALKNKGYKVLLFTKVPHRFHYSINIENRLGIKTKLKNLIIRIININKFIFYIYLIFFDIFMLPFYLYIIARYDVFIFTFGKSLFYVNYDLIILKKLRKKIIMNIGHGSDSRPPYLDGSFHEKSIDEIVKLTKKLKKTIERIEKYSDIIICHPYTAHFLKRKFVNWFAIGIPYVLTKFDQLLKIENTEISRNFLRILHAPSNPVFKGTYEIREIINGLVKKGYKIEYVEKSNVSNLEILKEIAKCDLIIDQLYSDTPLPTLAGEAACLRKPAIVCGYEIEKLKELYIPNEMVPPSLNPRPEDLEKFIKYFYFNKHYIDEIGKKLNEYVRKNLDAYKVAEKYELIIKNEIPENWLIDPFSIDYIYGAGINKEKLKNILREIIKNYGIEALELSHRPDLEKKFLEFIED